MDLLVFSTLEEQEYTIKGRVGKTPAGAAGDLKGEGGIVTKYGFDGIPKFVIINPRGAIVDKWTGYWKKGLKGKVVKY